MKTIFLLFFLLFPYAAYTQNISLSGFVKERGSRESLPFVNISIKDSEEGTYSNPFGFYAIQIPANRQVEISFSSVGYKTVVQTLILDKDSIVDVELTPLEQELDEVIVTAPPPSLEKRMGMIFIPLHVVKEIPSLMGEKDVIKTLQLLPGIQKGTEGSTALYVRGGEPGQNLIILDDAQIYNANHLFGFFSVFNGDAIKNISFWKGGFPARYGGRTSSVLDLQMKDGNKEKLKGEGGIGLIASRLTLEGPIKKGRSSFLVATRRSYLDLLTRPFMSKESMASYRFYDFNIKLNFDGNPKNKFFISGYFGNDKLWTREENNRVSSTINTKTDLEWENATTSLRWNHIFSERLFLNTTFAFSRYKFQLTDEYTRTGTRANSSFSEYNSSITGYSFKADFDYYFTNHHSIKSGLIFTHHFYRPRDFDVSNNSGQGSEKNIQEIQNQELGAYIEDTWRPSEKVVSNIGVRFNGLITSSKNYFVAEPRLNISYEVYENINFNASYARTNQFVHLLSNTGIGLSTDLWVPVTSKAPPQQTDQVSAGLSKDFIKQGYSLSVESYRKYLRNIVAYMEGATFLGIDDDVDMVNWEDNITIGEGESYGTEVLLKKNKGRLTGWLGYTLSWTIHQFDDLNYGKNFYPKYDSRHSISLVGIFKISNKITLSANWVYHSGNALTVPQGYYYGNFATGADIISRGGEENTKNEILTERINKAPYFGSRNSFRAEAYHRLDIAVQLHKKKAKYERYWEFGLYNAYNRKNPFYYYLKSINYYPNPGHRIELKKKSLFPILPSISYNIKF